GGERGGEQPGLCAAQQVGRPRALGHVRGISQVRIPAAQGQAEDRRSQLFQSGDFAADETVADLGVLVDQIGDHDAGVPLYSISRSRRREACRIANSAMPAKEATFVTRTRPPSARARSGWRRAAGIRRARRSHWMQTASAGSTAAAAVARVGAKAANTSPAGIEAISAVHRTVLKR